MAWAWSLVAATSKRYESLTLRFTQTGANVSSVSESGLWLRQGGVAGQTVIHARHANLDGTQLMDATFLSFDAKGVPVQRIEATHATLAPGAWQLNGVKRWPLDAANPEAEMQILSGSSLASDLTADRIRDSFGTPSAIPVWELPAYIAGLQKAGFSARNHQVWLQMQLALPMLMAAMVLMAAGFTMRHARFGKAGQMVLFALLSGFAIFFLRNFAQVLGVSGQIPIAMAAWAPPLAALLFAIGLLLHLEDG